MPGGLRRISSSRFPAGAALFGRRGYCSLFRRWQTAARARLPSIRGDVSKIGGRVVADSNHQIRRFSLRTVKPVLVIEDGLPPVHGEQRDFVFIFLYGIFSLTQEVSEWRCHRHEYRSDL